MRSESGEQPQAQKRGLSPNDSMENRLAPQGRELGAGNAIFNLGDQSTYSKIKDDGTADRSSLDSLSFLGGAHEILNKVSIGAQGQLNESAEVPRFLEKMTAAQRPTNNDLISRLQSNANQSLLADVNRTADRLALQEVGQASALGSPRNKPAMPADLRVTPPGGVDVLNSGKKKA